MYTVYYMLREPKLDQLMICAADRDNEEDEENNRKNRCMHKSTLWFSSFQHSSRVQTNRSKLILLK